jgi:hypothetical protein
MKPLTSVLAATVLLAGSLALATTPDNSKTYVATIDPPVGTIRCGFTVSGTVKTPTMATLSYGIFFRSEANIVTALNQREPVQSKFFPGATKVTITGSSKDVGDDELFQKRKSIQVQVRVWWHNQITETVGGGGPQIPTLAESAWVDVPLSSQPCATTKPFTGMSKPVSPTPVTVKH